MNMPQNFSGQNLRGHSFKGQNLAGADFSGADIRGANFTKANLRGANFSNTRAGLQTHQLIYAIFASSITIFLMGIISYIVGFYISNSFLNLQNIKGISSVVTVLTGIVLAVFLPIFYHAHLEVKETQTRGKSSVYSSLINFILGFLFLAITMIMSMNSYLLFLAKISFVTSILLLFMSLACAINHDVVIFTSFVGILVWIGAIVDTFSLSYNLSIFMIVFLAIICIYFSFQVLSVKSGYSDFTYLIYNPSYFGCTSFRSANLTNANFLLSRLGNTDFARARLTNTYFYQAREIEHALFRLTQLYDKKVSQLISSGNGQGKHYGNLIFTGINLERVNLSHADLRGADLSRANLRQANLEFANLTEVLAIGTDFTGASLTGACLEAWNIDSTTKLEEVDCEYIFFLKYPDQKGNRERRPHDPDKVFAPGDFAKLYKEVMNTVEVLLRNGMNPEAFNLAFQKLMVENPEITTASIQGLQKKGDDVLVTIEVPEGTDKAKIERDFLEPYKLQAALLEAKTLHAQDIKEITLALIKNPPANPIINLTNDVNSEIKTMNDSTDNSRKIENKDGNVIGNILGDEGTISGTVAHTINQLPDSPKPDQPGIKELLIELQAVIENDTALKPEDKTEALEQLKALAEAGSNPKEGAMQKTAKTALTMLKGIIASLPSAAVLVKTCSELLPSIASLFGL